MRHQANNMFHIRVLFYSNLQTGLYDLYLWYKMYFWCIGLIALPNVRGHLNSFFCDNVPIKRGLFHNLRTFILISYHQTNKAQWSIVHLWLIWWNSFILDQFGIFLTPFSHSFPPLTFCLFILNSKVLWKYS